MRWSSIHMLEMWWILSQSWPIPLWHRGFSNGQLEIYNSSRDAGSLSSGKHWSCSQSIMNNVWREVRCRRAVPFSDLRFLRLCSRREVRVVGSCPSSSGNESTPSISIELIPKDVREVSIPRFHLLLCANSFSHLLIWSDFKLEQGHPSSESDSRSSHPQIRIVCMVEGNLPCGNDFIPGHPDISNSLSDGYWHVESESTTWWLSLISRCSKDGR